MVEQRPFKAEVVGSTPTDRTRSGDGMDIVLSDKQLEGRLALLERRLTASALKTHTQYQRLFREAVNRNLRPDPATPEDQMVRIEMLGPGFDREV